MRKIFGLVLVVIGFSVCFIFLLVYYQIDKPTGAAKWEYYTESGIYTAVEEVDIENVTYSLETFMWRDFMPISPPDGKPLIAIIKIHAGGLEEFPLTITIERLWIIDGTELSSTIATNEYRIYGNTFEMVFRDGPKWGPGIKIDVVVKLKEQNSSSYYLKALNQSIFRSE